LCNPVHISYLNCRWIFYYQRRIWILLTGVTPPLLYACPKPGIGFPTSFFFCVQWRGVVDPFVDAIVYHHRLNVLFYAKVVLAYHICGHILWLLLLFYYYYTYNTIVFAGHRKTAYSKKQYPNSEYFISITPTTNILYYVLQDMIQIIILLLTSDKNYVLIFRFWFKVG
jgi:hypothetical protein